MSYESVAHEAKGRMGYWLKGYEGESNNCFCKIQLVDKKNIETKHRKLKLDINPFLPPKLYKIWRAPFATSELWHIAYQ